MQVRELIPYTKSSCVVWIEWKENRLMSYWGSIKNIPSYLSDRYIWTISPWVNKGIMMLEITII